MLEIYKFGFIERFRLTFGGVIVSHGNRSTLYVILSGAKAKSNFWRLADKSARRSRSGIYIRLSGMKRKK